MKRLITLLSLAVVGLSFGQEEEPKFNFSGSIDAYFRTNMTSMNDGGDNQAPTSSFVDNPGFAMGMANIVASYEGETVGFVADLMFGPRAEDAILNSDFPINQMYMYWNVNDKITLTMGRFNTFYGYEVISTPGNFNYSTSYLFSNGPFSHNGIKFDYKIDSDWSVMAAVMNPTDYADDGRYDTGDDDAEGNDIEDAGDYALGFQVGYKGQYFNVLESQGTLGLDFTGGFDITDNIYLGINAAKQTHDDPAEIGNPDDKPTDFYGVALYPQFTTSDTFSWGLRLEYFTFEDGLKSGSAGSEKFEDYTFFVPTITANYSVGNLTIKPELRLDYASDKMGAYSFKGNDNDETAFLSSFVLGAVYTF